MKRFFFLVLASIIISTSLPAMASANSSTSLINSARDYLGVKYVYGGTTTSGFDCSGFTQRAFRDVGISIPRTTGQQYAIGKSVSKANLIPGDLVFFNTTGKGVSHVGIYIGANQFINSASSKGVSIASINDPYYWGSRYIGARRVAGLNPPPKVSATPKEEEVKIPYPTRAEVAETIVKELGLTSNKATTFKDVPSDHPHIEAIQAVAEAGIFTGDAGSFNPEGKLTRAQLSKVLVQSFELQGETEISFKDVPADHWAKEPIATLYHNNVTTGYLDGNFGVNDHVTEGQLEKFISRLN